MKQWIKEFLDKYDGISKGVDEQLLFLLLKYFKQPQNLKNRITAMLDNWEKDVRGLISTQLTNGETPLRNRLFGDLREVVSDDEFLYMERHFKFLEGRLKEKVENNWVIPFGFSMAWYESFKLHNNPSLSERVFLWRDHLESNLERIVYPAQSQYLSTKRAFFDTDVLQNTSDPIDVVRSVQKFNGKFSNTVIKGAGITIFADAWRRSYRKALTDLPFIIGYKWLLDPSHPDLGCECEAYASIDFGLGSGVFPILEDVPGAPHHRCMCSVMAISKI